jgi:hypothetical protein
VDAKQPRSRLHAHSLRHRRPPVAVRRAYNEDQSRL